MSEDQNQKFEGDRDYERWVAGYEHGKGEVMEMLDWLMCNMKNNEWVRFDILEAWRAYRKDTPNAGQ